MLKVCIFIVLFFKLNEIVLILFLPPLCVKWLFSLAAFENDSLTLIFSIWRWCVQGCLLLYTLLVVFWTSLFVIYFAVFHYFWCIFSHYLFKKFSPNFSSLLLLRTVYRFNYLTLPSGLGCFVLGFFLLFFFKFQFA